MEYDEDLKMRQTNINLIRKLTKNATNRESRDREKRLKSEMRNRHWERVRMKRNMKGHGVLKKRDGHQKDKKDYWDT